MNENKILSSLCYLSIFFAPFLFPFIVWLLSGDQSSTRRHALRAMKLHFIPFIFIVIGGIVLLTTGIFSNHEETIGWTALLLFLVFGLASLALMIYNLFYGIKLLFT